MPDPEVLPPEPTSQEVPKAMTGTEQLLMLGAQLADSLVQKLRAPAVAEGDAEEQAPRRSDEEKERLRRAYSRLGRLNAEVARALGACRCFGRRPGCPLCGGEGAAGFYPIDPGAFAAFVAPAVVAEPEFFIGLLAGNAGAAPMQQT